MKVGDKIWCFNPRYSHIPGRVPKYIEEEITGETKISWLVGGEYCPRKINKKKAAYTKEQAEELMWFERNRHKIIRSAHNLDTPEEIRELAKLTGWKE